MGRSNDDGWSGISAKLVVNAVIQLHVGSLIPYNLQTDEQRGQITQNMGIIN